MMSAQIALWAASPTYGLMDLAYGSFPMSPSSLHVTDILSYQNKGEKTQNINLKKKMIHMILILIEETVGQGLSKAFVSCNHRMWKIFQFFSLHLSCFFTFNTAVM